MDPEKTSHPGDGARQPDERLLARLRRGDAAALEELYGLLGKRVYRLARAMLPQDSDAEDATQEVFLKLCERAHQFDGRSRFTTWLHRLTVNHCLNRIERERTRTTRDIHDESLVDRSTDPSEPVAHRDERGLIEALLERLSPHHRAVLVLREVEGLSYAEIAAALEVPVGTVMSRLARARERLLAMVPRTAHGERALPEPRNAS